ncbi:MAG TPA: hypothetical protein VFY11_15890 [Nocardioidaceae bacterium]|nr:hypothetical protein [Nocardioidaceae bacterium]
MILAVPCQTSTVAAGIGVPEHPIVITMWRWWCSQCRLAQPSGASSHAAGALARGDWHAAAEQCHTVGQLALFALAGGAR